MPAIKFTAIISCSSEDANYPAENLIKSNTTKKWKSSSWESSVSVVLELAKSTQINGIDIGNENSAFVEVLVGRSSSPKEDFQVLLVASSFMSPLESRNGTNCNRVRMFVGAQLCKSVAEQKWDRVKVVCTQPFNKHVKYGLSFITLHAPVSREDAQEVGRIGQFVVKESDDDIPVGSLFHKRKQHADEPLSGAAAIREASSPAALAKAASKQEDGNRHKMEVPTERGKVTSETNGKASSAHVTHKVKEDSKASTSSKNVARYEGKALKRDSSFDSSQKAKKRRQEVENAGKLRKPFNKLLEGVTFVISGYQNPHRNNLRSCALEMGAKYRPDWTVGCTHLVCAFENTPKFQQVKGKGKIVTKEWIEQCYQNRKRIPWRRFALDKKDKSKNESDSEILELKDEADDIASKEDERLQSESGSDTDDDIQRVQASMISNKDSDKSMDFTNPYEDDTDVDSDGNSAKENHSGTSNLPLPFLPGIFDGKTFYLNDDLDEDTITQLQRYIIAFKGKVIKGLSKDVHFAVARSRQNIKEVDAFPNVTLVQSDYIWACNDEGKLLPASSYQL